MLTLDPLSPKQKQAVTLIRQTISDGLVYLVGGSVRDLLLGRTIGDIDIVVSGVPLETLSERLEQVGRTDLVGKRFGVIKFTPPEGDTVDIALPRTEHALSGSGHRRDFAVDFDPNLPIERDLERRDFTVNAMAARLEHGGALTLVDAFGGREDLERKLMRAVGDPALRFKEDFSRMLRGIRFACELGFEIEPVTWRALQELIGHLNDLLPPSSSPPSTRGEKVEYVVPREVVAKELLRALFASPLRAFDLFDTSGAFHTLIPELYAMQECPQPLPWHNEGDVWKHTRLAMDVLASPKFKKEFGDGGLTAEMVVATLVHDIAKPPLLRTPEEHGVDRIRFDGHDTMGAKMATAICERLKLTSYKAARIDVDCERLAWLIGHHLIFVHGKVDDMRHTTIEKYFVRDPVRGAALLALTFADGSATVHEDGTIYLDHWYRARERIAEIKARLEQQSRGAALLTGEDVMRILNVRPSRRVGEALEKLHEAVLSGAISTREKAETFVAKLKNVQRPLVIITGPSGVGKTSILEGLLERISGLRYVVSYTTRQPREGEVDGKDYHFVSRDEFEAMLERDEMIESAEVYGDYYGRSKKSIDELAAQGFVPIVSVDVQGARSFVASGAPTFTIFVSPATIEELRARLQSRGKDDAAEIDVRLQAVDEEMAQKDQFDAVVVNAQGELASAIAEAERRIRAVIDN